MLFDSFEEQPHLPAITIKVGNRLRRDNEVVGQKIEGLAGVLVVILDTAK